MGPPLVKRAPRRGTGRACAAILSDRDRAHRPSRPVLQSCARHGVPPVTVLIDPPVWPAHDTIWSHLVSDSSYAELHAFAERAGLPRRAFDHDHYDIPEARYAEMLDLGATAVTGRELVLRLIRSGLRVAQRDKRR